MRFWYQGCLQNDEEVRQGQEAQKAKDAKMQEWNMESW